MIHQNSTKHHTLFFHGSEKERQESIYMVMIKPDRETKSAFKGFLYIFMELPSASIFKREVQIKTTQFQSSNRATYILLLLKIIN